MRNYAWRTKYETLNIDSEFAFLLKLSSECWHPWPFRHRSFFTCFVVCCCLSKLVYLFKMSAAKAGTSAPPYEARLKIPAQQENLIWTFIFRLVSLLRKFYYIHIKHPIKCEFKLKQMRYSSVCLIHKRWAYRRKYSHMDVILSADCISFLAWPVSFSHSCPCSHSARPFLSSVLSSIFVRAHRGLCFEFYALAVFSDFI